MSQRCGYDSYKKLVLNISRNSHNTRCCDCDENEPTHANITLGTFVCSSCIKILFDISPSYDAKLLYESEFDRNDFQILSSNGNALVNLIYLFNMPDKIQTKYLQNKKTKRDFLKKKYVHKEWKITDPHAIKMAYACNNQEKNFEPDLVEKLKMLEDFSSKYNVGIENPMSKNSQLNSNDYMEDFNTKTSKKSLDSKKSVTSAIKNMFCPNSNSKSDRYALNKKSTGSELHLKKENSHDYRRVERMEKSNKAVNMCQYGCGVDSKYQFDKESKLDHKLNFNDKRRNLALIPTNDYGNQFEYNDSFSPPYEICTKNLKITNASEEANLRKLLIHLDKPIKTVNTTKVKKERCYKDMYSQKYLKDSIGEEYITVAKPDENSGFNKSFLSDSTQTNSFYQQEHKNEEISKNQFNQLNMMQYNNHNQIQNQYNQHHQHHQIYHLYFTNMSPENIRELLPGIAATQTLSNDNSQTVTNEQKTSQDEAQTLKYNQKSSSCNLASKKHNDESQNVAFSQLNPECDKLNEELNNSYTETKNGSFVREENPILNNFFTQLDKNNHSQDSANSSSANLSDLTSHYPHIDLTNLLSNKEIKNSHAQTQAPFNCFENHEKNYKTNTNCPNLKHSKN